MKFWKKQEPEIQFLCHKEDFGIIPEPYPARKYMPDWFKNLPPKLSKGMETGTLKRCPPFLDAMVTGWIIPLAADVEIKSNEDASQINYQWLFNRPMIDNHGKYQVTTDNCPAPHHDQPPMKWRNWWAIKAPPGYSLLFTPPFNRTETRFTCFTGLVDAEYFEFINFPFIWNAKNWFGVVEAGTPLVQVIPIKRSDLVKESVCRAFTDEEDKELEKTRAKRRSHPSYYRDQLWERK